MFSPFQSMHVIEVPILFLCACVCMWLFITQRWTPEKIYGLKFTAYADPPGVGGKCRCLPP